MSMSDCPECWETPCVCGHDYKNWSPGRLRKQIEMLTGVLAEKSQTARLSVGDGEREELAKWLEDWADDMREGGAMADPATMDRIAALTQGSRDDE